MDKNNSPIKFNLEGISKLSEPIVKLLEVVSKGASKLYDPTHKVRMAKADMKVEIIQQVTNLITDEIQLRGLSFLIEQSGKKQLNIEQIVNKSIKYLPEKLSTSEEPDKGWIMDFFDLSQNSTDEDIQELWAKILADEVDKPNSRSRRLMHNLKIMSPIEANFFKTIAGCECEIYTDVNEQNKSIYNEEVLSNKGVIVSINDELILGEYKNETFDYNQLLYLTHIGFFNRVNFYIADDFEFVINKIKFRDNIYNLKQAEIEVFEYTSLGVELMEVVQVKRDEEYEKYLVDYLNSKSLLIK